MPTETSCPLCLNAESHKKADCLDWANNPSAVRETVHTDGCGTTGTAKRFASCKLDCGCWCHTQEWRDAEDLREAYRILAGGSGLTPTTSHLKALHAALLREREAQLREFVATKEPNGYPLWFNRAVHACHRCDPEDLCGKHGAMAERDFADCEEEIGAFVAAAIRGDKR